MLTELCQELRNWFCTDADKHVGDFTISGGVITPSADLQEHQYYRIVGSVFNDGVHMFGDDNERLLDETFHGAIWSMKIPDSVIALSQKIDEYNASDMAKVTPFTSESFGGYSYTRGTRANGTSVTWKDVFSNDLNKWRKI